MEKKNKAEKITLHSTYGLWQPHEPIRNKDKFLKYFEPWIAEFLRREREDDDRNELADTEAAKEF